MTGVEPWIPVIVAAMAAIIASLITAWFLRRSNKEANDTNAFKVVTDQLLALNAGFREELDEVKKELASVKATVALQEKELEATREGRDEARRANAALAGYIKKLLALWPVGSTPPGPDGVLDWERHL